MDEREFRSILNNIEGYTDYLYFHLLGEPVLHPKINEFIDCASDCFKINITTNGYLIKRIENNKNIRQLNISLHSFDLKYHKSVEDYLGDIVNSAKVLSESGTFISYRIWASCEHKDAILNYLSKYYQKEITFEKQTIQKNIFLDVDHQFEWPTTEGQKENNGSCLGLKAHIGILVNGDVVPCCMDTKGDIVLGNIHTESLETIIQSTKAQAILKGFQENKRIEQLCQNCNFK